MKNPHDAVIQVRLTETDRAIVDEAAGQARLSLSAWVRTQLLTAAIRETQGERLALVTPEAMTTERRPAKAASTPSKPVSEAPPGHRVQFCPCALCHSLRQAESS
jgi:hypothetical protein